MSNLNDIAVQVQDLLEEQRVVTIGANFWNKVNEIYPAIVEGMNEAALITGDPEVRSGIVTLPLTQPFAFAPFVFSMPATSLMIVRIDTVGGGAVKKVFACDLDRRIPGWEGHIGASIKYWFPIGMSCFGVYPSPTVQQQILMTTLGWPVTTGQPYSGLEASPYREEYEAAFHDYATHVCRLKEGGTDFEESMPQMQGFQDKMVELTKFAARRGLSRFTKLGRQAKINDVKLV